MNLACLINPIGCVDSFLASLPLEQMLYAFLVGLVLGALLGWKGVAAVIAIGGAIGFAAKRRTADEFHEHVGGKDAVKPVAKPKSRRHPIIGG